jgi:hypothetical protein
VLVEWGSEFKLSSQDSLLWKPFVEALEKALEEFVLATMET